MTTPPVTTPPGTVADFAGRYGPVALVTGASSGIGYAFAEELASRGLDLVVTARRLDRLEGLAERLGKEHGVTVTPVPCDLADPAAHAGAQAGDGGGGGTGRWTV